MGQIFSRNVGKKLALLAA